LIAASGVRASDRVLVFGYDILGYLDGLARHGTAAATGLYAGQPCHPHEPVDVVWFTCVSDIDAEVTQLTRGLGSPRLVAIELMGQADLVQLRRLLCRLRDKGLSQTSYYKVGYRCIVTAQKPSSVRSTAVAPAVSFIPLHGAAAP